MKYNEVQVGSLRNTLHQDARAGGEEREISPLFSQTSGGLLTVCFVADKHIRCSLDSRNRVKCFACS